MSNNGGTNHCSLVCFKPEIKYTQHLKWSISDYFAHPYMSQSLFAKSQKGECLDYKGRSLGSGRWVIIRLIVIARWRITLTAQMSKIKWWTSRGSLFVCSCCCRVIGLLFVALLWSCGRGLKLHAQANCLFTMEAVGWAVQLFFYLFIFYKTGYREDNSFDGRIYSLVNLRNLLHRVSKNG